MNDLAIVIPCRNEGKNIINILRKLKKNKIFLINDASSDKIIEKINKFKNVKVINNSKRMGYENSVLKAIKYLYLKKEKKIKYILTMDADGDHNPLYVKKIYNKIKNSKLDLIIGNRSTKNRKSEIEISEIFKKKFNFEDPLSGFKIYKKNKLFNVFKKCSKKYFLVDLCIFFFNKKYKIGNLSIITRKNKSRNPRVIKQTVNKKIFSIKKII
tara:strand:- start:1854 stop:2492 length:639 start_codon:yes stop_codon:yes gene_type:complete